MNVERIPVSDCIRDHTFQEWLAEEQLMRRSAIRPAQLEQIGTTHVDTKGEQVIALLTANIGYIVPNEDIAAKINSTRQAKGSYPASQGTAHARTLLLHPEILNTFTGIGAAIGVRRLMLNQSHVPLTYYLWQRMDSTHYISRDDLAIILYGSVDDNKRNTVRNNMNNIRRNLNRQTNLTLDYHTEKDRHGPSYRLRKKDIPAERLPKLRTYAPDYYSLDFQDWLATNEVGILRRNSEALQYSPLQFRSDKRSFGDKEALAAAILWEYTGYVVPLDYFNGVIYEGKATDRQIRELITRRLSTNISDDERIKLWKELGYTKDVDDLTIGSKGIVMLHGLWEQLGRPVPGSELEEKIADSGLGVEQKTFSNRMGEIRQVLKDSFYQVTLQRFPNKESTYTLERRGTVFDANKQITKH